MVHIPFFHPDMDLIPKWVHTVLTTILTLLWPGSIQIGRPSANFFFAQKPQLGFEPRSFRTWSQYCLKYVIYPLQNKSNKVNIWENKRLCGRYGGHQRSRRESESTSHKRGLEVVAAGCHEGGTTCTNRTPQHW